MDGTEVTLWKQAGKFKQGGWYIHQGFPICSCHHSRKQRTQCQVSKEKIPRTQRAWKAQEFPMQYLTYFGV